MKLLHITSAFLCFFTSLLSAQPLEETTTFQFRLQVDSLVFKKGNSNIYLNQINPTKSAGYALRLFQKKDFRGDTLVFELPIKHYGALTDTLILELFNTTTKHKMKVVCGSTLNPALFYTIDLKEFIYRDDVDGQFFFDLVEIGNLLEQKDSLYWNGCVIQQTIFNKYYKTITIQVKKTNIGRPTGLFYYSYNKIQAGKLKGVYADLDVKNFFVPYDPSRQVIYKQNRHPKATIIAQYQYLPNRHDRRNKLFGHSAHYIFYDDFTFSVREADPPMVVSLVAPRAPGIGIWCVVGDQLVLTTPPHWSTLYKGNMADTPITFYPYTSYTIKGSLLIVHSGKHPYRLKRKWTKGQKRLSTVQ